MTLFEGAIAARAEAYCATLCDAVRLNAVGMEIRSPNPVTAWVWTRLMWYIIYAILVTIVWIGWNQGVERRAIVRRSERLRARVVYTDDHQWLTEHWPSTSSRECVVKVCQRLAERLGVHYSQLYAADRFSEELSLKGWFIVPVDTDLEVAQFFEEDLEVLSGQQTIDLLSSRTLGALVQLLEKTEKAAMRERYLSE